LGGGPSEHSPAEVNNDRETVRQFDEQTASPDDDRHADQKPEDDQDEASVSRAGHRQHVVEAHHGVGDDDGADGGPEGGAGLNRVMISLFLHEQSVGDPDEEYAADQQKAGNFQDPDDEDRRKGTDGDGPCGSPEDGLFLLFLRQVSGGHSDDDGIVTCQNQIDNDDGEKCDEKIQRKPFHWKVPLLLIREIGPGLKINKRPSLPRVKVLPTTGSRRQQSRGQESRTDDLVLDGSSPWKISCCDSSLPYYENEDRYVNTFFWFSAEEREPSADNRTLQGRGAAPVPERFPFVTGRGESPSRGTLWPFPS